MLHYTPIFTNLGSCCTHVGDQLHELIHDFAEGFLQGGPDRIPDSKSPPNYATWNAGAALFEVSLKLLRGKPKIQARACAT